MSSSDWIHCNKCFQQPSQGVSFCFSSCGHILCVKCASAPNGTRLKGCIVCKKPANIVDVNRTMRAELQLYFRSPLDTASQYMATLKKALEFQTNNRMRLQKHLIETNTKAVKFAECAKAEIKKRQESEKKDRDDKNKFLKEIERLRGINSTLQKKIASRDLEIQSLRTTHGKKRDSGFGSCSSSASSKDVSFDVNFATSTPVFSPLLESHTPEVQKLQFGARNISPIFHS